MKMPVITIKQDGWYFLLLTHKHTFGIIADIERMFWFLQSDLLYWQYMDCRKL